MPGRLAGGDDVFDAVGKLAAAVPVPSAPGGQRPEEHVVAVERVHPDPVAEQRPAAAPPGRVDGEHGDSQLVLLVGAQPADQFVGERGLARTAGPGDAEDRDPPGGRRVAQRRQILRGQPAFLQAGDGPRQRAPLAR
jgi:hypothetical protein